MLGHLIWVPAETGASYGDLDVGYLTATLDAAVATSHNGFGHTLTPVLVGNLIWLAVDRESGDAVV
jgi:hypothetical protein